METKKKVRKNKEKTVYNDLQKERIIKTLSQMKEIRFRVTPEVFEEYQVAAEEGGYKSMRQFYMTAIENQIKSDKENRLN